MTLRRTCLLWSGTIRGTCVLPLVPDGPHDTIDLQAWYERPAPVTCDCTHPAPDRIGECQTCRRLVWP